MPTTDEKKKSDEGVEHERGLERGLQQSDEIHAQKEGNGRRRDKNERKKGIKAKNKCEE